MDRDKKLLDAVNLHIENPYYKNALEIHRILSQGPFESSSGMVAQDYFLRLEINKMLEKHYDELFPPDK
jgi:hypothetical protein